VTTTDPRLRAFDILTRVAERRGQVYRWLAIGFYPPDAELVSALCSGRLVDEIEAATAWLGQDQARLMPHLKSLTDSASVAASDLESHYTRLFGKSVDRVPSRESAYRWRDASDLLSLCDGVAQTLRQEYAQFNAASVNGRDDHVAVELEFLSFLCDREAAAWAMDAPDEARQLRRRQRTFLDDHLGRWLAEFCQRVRDAAPGTFYAALAALTDAWLSLEHGPGYLPAVKKR
jgi:DMSO reductase family type II enzyme chaperone